MNPSSNKGWASWNSKTKEKKLTPTLAYTLQLFLQNKTIPQIAKEREFAIETVERQIIDLITKSFITPEKVISSSRYNQIRSVITKENINSLKSIKELLPEEITWFEIKCAIASINANKK